MIVVLVIGAVGLMLIGVTALACERPIRSRMLSVNPVIPP